MEKMTQFLYQISCKAKYKKKGKYRYLQDISIYQLIAMCIFEVDSHLDKEIIANIYEIA
jgi:hypothetical protein